MKCPLCNAEIKEGSLYCEKCGEDIHIVPDFDPIVEDACNTTIENMTQDIFSPREEVKPKERTSDAGLKTSGGEVRQEKTQNTSHEPEKVVYPEDTGKKQRSVFNMPKPLNYILIGVAFVIIIALTGLSFVFFTSDKYKLRKADQAYEAGEYSKAVFLYQELLDKNWYDTELLEKYGMALLGKGDTETYMEVLLQIFDSPYSDAGSRDDALEGLISIYDSNKDFGKIQELIQKTGNAVYRKKYSMYFTDPPVIVTENGSYQLPQLLSISAEDPDVSIYYSIQCTKDGVTNSIVDDKEYTGPILLDDGIFDITAYCVNAKGVRSDTVSGIVEIKDSPPAAPVITPRSGEYFESVPIVIENYSDGSTAFYYTTDGSNPNSSSYRYTEPLVMMPGVSWYKFICIDDKGLSSDIVDVRYDFNIEYKFTLDQAHELLMNYLYVKGLTISTDGSLDSGGKADMVFVGIEKQDGPSGEDDTGGSNENTGEEGDGTGTEVSFDTDYKYVFDEYFVSVNGKKTALDNRYTVDLNTGYVEKVTE